MVSESVRNQSTELPLLQIHVNTKRKQMLSVSSLQRWLFVCLYLQSVCAEGKRHIGCCHRKIHWRDSLTAAHWTQHVKTSKSQFFNVDCQSSFLQEVLSLPQIFIQMKHSVLLFSCFYHSCISDTRLSGNIRLFGGVDKIMELPSCGAIQTIIIYYNTTTLKLKKYS